MWQAIEQGISGAVGETFRVKNTRPVGGGCINQAMCLQGDCQSYFLKLNSADRLDMFEAEVAGLAAIRASSTVRAPEPIACGVADNQSWLVLEYIELSTPKAHSSSRLGELLAAMHRNSAQAYGWERDNTLGLTPQHNEWTVDWISFVQENRLGSQLKMAYHNGLPSATVDRGNSLLQALPDIFAGYRPEPSLLHGDLWGGNWASDDSGEPVIFDPAVYYGDREADLAMTELFGGFDQNFYRAYNQAWPLNPGYKIRKDLYNLYHILNHFNLFGGGYGDQARATTDRLLAQLA